MLTGWLFWGIIIVMVVGVALLYKRFHPSPKIRGRDMRDMTASELRDKETLLREVNENAGELRQSLVTSIIPADISPTAKIPFKLRMFRELALHRVSDLSDAACLHYNAGSTIPAFVLTRAAFETMAILHYVNKKVEDAISEGSVDVLGTTAMKVLFGTKDKFTDIEAVNVLTVIGHLEKDYSGFQEMYEFMCEFAHPNFSGMMPAYARVEGLDLDNPHEPLALGAEAAKLDPEYGLLCLRIAILLTDSIVKQLAKQDASLVQLCEDD